MVELLVPLGLFGAMVLVVGQLARLASNISLNRTLREALRSHPPSVAALAERLDARQPWADALAGWMFIAFAIGLVLMGLFEEVDERREIFRAAIVPLVVGVTVILYVRQVKRELVGDGSSPTAAKPPAPVVTASPVANSPPRRPASRRKS